MTRQSSLQSRKEVQTLFAQGGPLATNAAEVDRALSTAKSTGHFLLDFDHANISFGEVIVKRHVQAVQKEQDGLLVFAQTIQQIAPGMLCGFASFSLWGGGAWMHLVPLIQQGQKAARAFMRDAPILILDEPTSALDPHAEYDVFTRFRMLTKDKTTIFISHRFSTVRLADRIFVIKHGQIVEKGSHEELMLLGGRYAELFNLQAEAYH